MKQVTDFISCCGRGVSMILFTCTRIHEIVIVTIVWYAML